MSNDVKIHRITLRHVAAIPDLDVDLAGKSAVVGGGNAAGKSTVVAALETLFGLRNATLARLTPLADGAPAIDPATGEPFVPEVCAILHGPDGSALRIRAEGDKRTVEEQDGAAWRRIKRPVGTVLSQLVDPLAQPSAFLSAKPDQQIAMLLEAVPCDGYNRDELVREAVSSSGEAIGSLMKRPPEGLHPLDEIEHIFGSIFAFRTDIGRQQALAKATSEKLLTGVPAEEPEPVADRILRAEQERSRLADKLAAEKARARADYDRAVGDATKHCKYATDVATMGEDAARQAAESEFAAWIAEQRAALERRIAERKAELLVRLDAIANASEDEQAKAREAERAAAGRANEELTRAMDESASGALAVAKLEADLATLREQQKAVAVDRDRRSEARKAQAEADTLAGRYAALTRALDAIKAYRAKMAAQLPIPGLEIRLGDKRAVLVDGIPWESVNDARQRMVWAQLAMLRAQAAGDEPRLKVVLLDDAEHLDDASREALLAEADRQGVQVILASVVSGGGPLVVR